MEYKITRKKIKNFIIRIYPDRSIKISVPMRATSKEIEKFIFSKKEWMEKSLKKIEKKIEEAKKNREEEKNFVKIFGKNYKKNTIIFLENKIEIEEDKINIFIKNKNETLIENEIEKYKIEKLSEVLEEYIRKYSKLLNTSVSFYKIKRLKATWGIYHKKQNYISFSFNLIHKEKKFVEYVVLHEMCHIFHLNHQKEFWNLVSKYMPDYKNIRK